MGSMGDAGGTVEVVDGLVGGVEGLAIVLVVVERGHVADEGRPGGLAPEGVVLGDSACGVDPVFSRLRGVGDGAEVIEVYRVGAGCNPFASGAGVVGDGGVGPVDGEVLGPGLRSDVRSVLRLLLGGVSRHEVGAFLVQGVESAG